MAGMSVDGLISGLDTTSLISQLVQAEAAPQTQLRTKLSTANAAAAAYRRSEPGEVDCPIVVLHWRDDPDVSLDQLQGWRQYSNSVDIRVVDGGHYDFMTAPDELLTLLTCWR